MGSESFADVSNLGEYASSICLVCHGAEQRASAVTGFASTGRSAWGCSEPSSERGEVYRKDGELSFEVSLVEPTICC